MLSIALRSWHIGSAAQMEPPLLDSVKNLGDSAFNGLPKDQWTLDMKRMYDWSWAATRLYIIEHLTGWTNGSQPFLREASTDGEKQFCQS